VPITGLLHRQLVAGKCLRQFPSRAAFLIVARLNTDGGLSHAPEEKPDSLVLIIIFAAKNGIGPLDAFPMIDS